VVAVGRGAMPGLAATTSTPAGLARECVGDWIGDPCRIAASHVMGLAGGFAKGDVGENARRTGYAAAPADALRSVLAVGSVSDALTRHAFDAEAPESATAVTMYAPKLGSPCGRHGQGLCAVMPRPAITRVVTLG